MIGIVIMQLYFMAIPTYFLFRRNFLRSLVNYRDATVIERGSILFNIWKSSLLITALRSLAYVRKGSCRGFVPKGVVKLFFLG